MSKIKTFFMGGIHPEKHKISSEKAIINADIPEIAVIPVKQHIGAPAKILVKKGDKVKVGQLIMTFDREKLKAGNYDDITMMVVLDQGNAKKITFVNDQDVVAKETDIAQII